MHRGLLEQQLRAGAVRGPQAVEGAPAPARESRDRARTGVTECRLAIGWRPENYGHSNAPTAEGQYATLADAISWKCGSQKS